jgi:hypothetical protein
MSFLAEGYLPQGHGVWGGWQVEMLSTGQAHRLLDFLGRECADHPFQQNMVSLLRRLFPLSPPAR